MRCAIGDFSATLAQKMLEIYSKFGFGFRLSRNLDEQYACSFRKKCRRALATFRDWSDMRNLKRMVRS